MEKLNKTRLARLINAEVQAQLKRYAMARAREEFINRLIEVLGPALSHFYRYTLATINSRTDQVEKWQRHEEEFLEQFAERLLEPTKAKSLDRRKAADQALKELMQTDQARRRVESATFRKAYRLPDLVPLTENSNKEFLAHVRDIVSAAYPS